MTTMKGLLAATLGLSATAGLLLAAAAPASAETRVTYKSAKSTSSYYQMGVQIAEGVKAASGGDIIVTVEESQGSVQNVKEAPKRGANYVFTTPAGLIAAAQGGSGKFEGDDTAPYQEIRALFPIPALTMHFVVNAEAGIESFADLEGKSLVIGKGSFGASEAEKYIKLFGLEGKVELVNVELNAAVPALRNGQIDGFATAGSYPAPNVLEAAAGVGIDLISFSDEQVAETGRDRIVIPAGTYPGVDEDTVTTTLPVGAYTTTETDEETAYQLTKAFWEGKKGMADDAAWWKGVDAELLATLGGRLHAGAARYYEEAGMEIPESLL